MTICESYDPIAAKHWTTEDTKMLLRFVKKKKLIEKAYETE